MKKYITTAIPYVNSIPHVGFALEIVQTDVLARFYRQLGFDVYFVSGTDENSFKIARSAIEQGLSPKDLVDANSQKFYELKDILNISFDDFIRTTEKRHFEGAKKFWQAMDPDDIYIAKWESWYCTACEAHYQKEELVDDNKCPEHLREAEYVKESNYFFRIGKYKKKIKELIESKKLSIIPYNRKQEILNLLDEFHDFNISRYKKYDWGINVPGDDSQIIYPWVEALTNYINAVGYASDSDKFQKWWADNKVDIIHVIGKGITKFHAIYWPAMLLSAGIRLPNKIFVHGYLTIEGQKISKSLGNVISPLDVVNKYGTDATRYFLLREFSSYEDGDYTEEKFIERYNGDLANGLGNFAARVSTLAAGAGPLPTSVEVFEAVVKEIKEARNHVEAHLAEYKFHEALAVLMALVSYGDRYVNTHKPWETKDKEVIFALVAILEDVGQLLRPFLPETAERILSGITRTSDGLLVKKISNLFPRL